MKHREVNLKFRIPHPEWHIGLLSTRWLPTPGNVLFTLLVVGGLLWASSVGALPFRAPSLAGNSTTTISYQGRLADSAGNPITTSGIGMQFCLYDTDVGGSPLDDWCENHPSVPVEDGLFSVLLGSINPIPVSTLAGHSTLWLGITVGSDSEMRPREQVASVPYAMIASTVADGSITTVKIADGAVTTSKLSGTTIGTDLPLSAGFLSPPNSLWQRAQYRRIGDIVYLRGLITIDSGSITDDTVVANLPEGFRPPKNLAFVAEPHSWLLTKHRVNIEPDGTIRVSSTAGTTPHVDLDGIFFSISN